MSQPKRPSPRDTDEDLIQLQNEFLRNRMEPSVKIIKRDSPTGKKKLKSDNEPYPAAQFCAEDDLSTNVSACNSPPSDSSEKLQGTTPHPTVVSNAAFADGSQQSTASGGMPQKKKSLFAQRMEKARAGSKSNVEEPSGSSEISPDVVLSPSSSQGEFGDRSYILSGKEADDLHRENIEQLSKLTMDEIREEQQRLMSQLSASTISFLKSRRKTAMESTENHSDLETKMKNVSLGSQKQTKFESSKNNIAQKSRKAFSNSTATSVKTMTEPPQNTNAEQPLESLPINPNEAKQWLHMGVVEKEKLEWMKDLPPTNSLPAPNEPYAARFDFQGMLLPYNDNEIEVNQGLHHHGDEPERPGYTLQELMQLSRSSVQQQRVMGLNSLGNVLLKAKLGIYDQILQQNIVKELLDAGIFLLLRFSMDDTSPPVVVAAVTAMRNLLFNEPDEGCLDYLLGCEGSLQHPCLEVPCEGDQKTIQETKDQEKELKDFEIIQLDVLKGAERTNLILRLGYILDVVKGPPDIVLDVLIRLARHSQLLAEGVVSCGGLLRTISDELLTARVVPYLAAGHAQQGYGEPSAKALKLFCVLAAHSRIIANTLVDKFNIMDSVMTYVSMSSPELPHLQSLVVGGYYLWQTLMNYGLASQTITDLFPILMKQLHFHSQLTSAAGANASAPGHELATALIGALERAADIVTRDHGVLDPRPVFQLCKLVVDCMCKWLTQLSSCKAEKTTWSCVKMVGAAFSCLAAAASCAKTLDAPESKSFLQKLESLTFQYVLPFVKTQYLDGVLGNLIRCSFLLSKDDSGHKRDPDNLPSLGAMEWGGESLVPGLLPGAPHPLISGLLRYMTSTHDLFGVSVDKFEGILMQNPKLVKYVHALVSQTLRNSNHWFARQELFMLHHLMVLVVLKPSAVGVESKREYALLALCLVDLIHSEDKHLIAELLPHTLFSRQFIMWGMTPNSTVDQQLLEQCLSRLPTLGLQYCKMLGIRYAKLPAPSARMSLTSQVRGTESCLPVDWHFSPLLMLYGQYNAQDRARSKEDDSITLAINCLQFLFIIETVWQNARRPLSVTARWCRLSLVFLAGADLFLDADVKRFLKVNLDLVLRDKQKLNFQEKIPGLTSFYDLYGELLLQFSAVSYGDRLFGAFILLPLQQKQDPQLRRMIWGEYLAVLRFLSTTFNELGVPMEEYLHPCETDPSLLSAYLESVARGHLIETRCPVMYRVAIHHVSSFIHLYPDNKFACILHKQIERLGNKTLKDRFLTYEVPHQMVPLQVP